MKISEEMFEVLIGKFLDGEITPSEQRLLEARLNTDPKASELLEQFQNLHDLSSEAISIELMEKGKSPHEIFENAFQSTKHKSHHIIKPGGWIRYAMGVAAGLIFGLVLHFTLLQMSSPEKIENPVASTPKDGNYVKKLSEEILYGPPQQQMPTSGNLARNVDWYNFTDENGNEYIVEGIRGNIVRPALYEQGL